MEQTRIGKPNAMAMASLILGALSVLSVLTVYYSVFFGSMGILFAVLSRGDSLKMPDKAVNGFIISAVSMSLSILLTAVSVFLMIRLFGLETALDPDALQEALTQLYTRLLNDLPATGGSTL